MMPKPSLPIALLATLLTVSVASARDPHRYDPPQFARIRPGATSAGPPRAPVRRDHEVQPAAFQSQHVAKPLVETKPLAIADKLPELRPALDDTVAEATTEPERPADETAEATLTPPHPPAPAANAKADDALQPPASTSIVKRRRRGGESANPFASLLDWRPNSQTLTASGGALAIVVSLLLSLVWLVRKCAPKAARPLPREVVEVLGRAPLGGKQTTQLIRVGPKLLLVAISPDGVETLTEVSDPGEVARIIAACETGAGKGSAAEFDQLLAQLANEPTDAERHAPPAASRRDDPHDAQPGFAEGLFDPRSIAAAYANTPGGRGEV